MERAARILPAPEQPKRSQEESKPGALLLITIMSEAGPRREPAVGSSSSLTSSPASNGASRRTPVIRLHGAPTLSPRPAPKKGGRRASEFCFREPPEYVHLAPPRSTVSTPPPGRKRSASLPHVRSPSPVPPPLARAARAHHAAQQQQQQAGPGAEDDEEDDEEEERCCHGGDHDHDDDREEEDEDEGEAGPDGRDTPPPPMAACPEEPADSRQQHRSRLLGTTAADRRKSTPCQPKFLQCRRGRPSLDLTAAQAAGHITLGSHLESEIARRRHSVAATAAGADKPAATSSDRGLVHGTQATAAKNRLAAAAGGGAPVDALANEAARRSWLREASSSEDDDDDDFAMEPRTVTPNSSPVMPAPPLAGTRRPVS